MTTFRLNLRLPLKVFINYYKLSHYRNCPSHLHFNNEFKYCDYPEQAECTECDITATTEIDVETTTITTITEIDVEATQLFV